LAKNAFDDYSTTAASNTDIDGVDSTGATGLVKSGDNYTRSVMSHAKAKLLDLGAVNTVAGTGDAVTVTLASNTTAFYDGMRFSFNAPATNTGAATIAVKNSAGTLLGTPKIRKWASGVETALSAGDMTSNHNINVVYDSARDTAAGAFMIDGSASVAASTTTAVLTGTSTADFATPNAIAALWEKGSDEASAGTVAFGEGGFFHVTGTTTITDIDFDTAKDGRAVDVVFDGALTLTHNGTTLQLPGGANITTAAGDRARFVQDSSDNIICLWYVRAGAPPQDGPHVILEDQKSSGTAGGTFTSGADQVRTINTEVYDPFGLCSISSNQFTLLAGTYHIAWSAPASFVNAHQTLLYNVTDTAEVKRGSTEFSTSGLSGEIPTRSFGSTVTTITGSKAFEIRHRANTTRATTGFGLAGSFGTEVYTRVEITKIA
jgi:hypothetical protein